MGKLKGFKSLAPHIQKALKKSVEKERPFVLAPFNWVGNKISKRKDVINKGYAKYINKIWDIMNKYTFPNFCTNRSTTDHLTNPF